MVMPRLYAIADAGVLAERGVGLRAFVEELRDAGVRLVQYRDKVGSPEEVLRGAEVISEVFAGVDAVLVMNDRADLAMLAGWGVHVGQGDLGVVDARRVLAGNGMFPHPCAEGAHEWGTRSAGEGKSRFPSGMTERKAGTLGSRKAGALGLGKVNGLGWVVGVSTHTEDQVRAADPMSQRQDMGHLDVRMAGFERGADYIAVGPVFCTSTKKDAEAAVGLEGVRRARALTRKPLVAIGGITRENARSVVDAGADVVAVISGLLVEGERVGKVAEDFLRILG